MALTKTRLGTNEDGSPQYHYASDGHVVVTGPHISGTVTTADGTVYDISDLVTEVAEEHALEVADLVGKRFETEGHPLHDADNPFVHTPTDLTHADGAPSAAFADAVHAHVPAGKDSSPAGIIAALKKKG